MSKVAKSNLRCISTKRWGGSVTHHPVTMSKIQTHCWLAPSNSFPITITIWSPISLVDPFLPHPALLGCTPLPHLSHLHQLAQTSQHSNNQIASTPEKLTCKLPSSTSQHMALMHHLFFTRRHFIPDHVGGAMVQHSLCSFKEEGEGVWAAVTTSWHLSQRMCPMQSNSKPPLLVLSQVDQSVTIEKGDEPSKVID